jgi:hypothetical protein
MKTFRILNKYLKINFIFYKCFKKRFSNNISKEFNHLSHFQSYSLTIFLFFNFWTFSFYFNIFFSFFSTQKIQFESFLKHFFQKFFILFSQNLCFELFIKNILSTVIQILKITFSTFYFNSNSFFSNSIDFSQTNSFLSFSFL